MTEVIPRGIVQDPTEKWDWYERVLNGQSSRLREDPFELDYLTREDEPREYRRYAGMPTGRTLGEVALIHGYTTDSFLQDVEGKVIVDAGGGHSRLQQQARLSGVETTIINIDFPETFGVTDLKDPSQHARKPSLESPVIGEAQIMSFGDELVDKVMATYSVPFLSHSADHVEGFLNEALRILKIGGDLSISPYQVIFAAGDAKKYSAKLRLYGMLRSMSSMPQLKVEFGEGQDTGGMGTEYVKITKLDSLKEPVASFV